MHLCKSPICYGLNVCVILKFICWNLIPQCDGVRRWDLGKSWGWGPHEWDWYSYKRGPQKPLAVKTQQEVTIHEPGSGFSGGCMVNKKKDGVLNQDTHDWVPAWHLEQSQGSVKVMQYSHLLIHGPILRSNECSAYQTLLPSRPISENDLILVSHFDLKFRIQASFSLCVPTSVPSPNPLYIFPPSFCLTSCAQATPPSRLRPSVPLSWASPRCASPSDS